MNTKPELIVFSQNLMGGGYSFHKNMIDNAPDSSFDIKCIYLDPLHWVAKRLEEINLKEDDIIFTFQKESEYQIAKRLNNHISNRDGVIVANLPEELFTLDYFPKSQKTVYFICHDKGFLYLTKKYDYLIDVFITHNIEVYESIKALLPTRLKDIYFIQHGVRIQFNEKIKNDNELLNLVFLARHVKSKGIYDLPKINQLLLDQNVKVNWTILGDGEENKNFKNEVKNLPNFHFFTPKSNEEVITILKKQDVYVLPSSHDGLPVSLLEAMSVGCVPIVYNFSEGIKKVITSDIGYVTNLGNISEITEKIVLLNNDRNLLNVLSLNSIKKVENEFNIKIQANAYFELYKNFRVLKKERKFALKSFENKYYNYKLVRIGFKLLRVIKNKHNIK